MTGKQPITHILWPTFTLPFICVFLVLLWAGIGCGVSGPQSSNRLPAGNATGQSGWASRSSSDAGPAASSSFKDTGKDQPQAALSGAVVRFEQQDGRHVAVIPVLPETSITPAYSQKRLKLKLTPHFGLSRPSSISDPLVASMDTDFEAKAHSGSLTISFTRDIQFYISRPKPDTARVIFTPHSQDRSAQPDSLNQTPLRLQAIDFERSGRDLVVSLTASHPFEYQLGSSSDHKLRMLFPGLHVPPRLVKLYRLGKFDSAVRSALLTDTPDGAELILSGIQDPVPVRRQGPRMHLHIPARTAAAAAPSGPDRSLRQPETKASSLTGPDREDSRKRVQLFPGMKEEYTGSPISLDLQDADIEHVLRLISEVAGYDLILDQEVSGTISLKLDSVPWDQALDLVLMQKSLGMVQQGNILRVAPVQTLQKEQEQILKARRSSLQAQKSKQDLAPLHTEYIQINYAKSPDLQKSVQKFLSDRGEISHDAKTNQLIVSDTAQAIDKVRSVVRKLDRAERQVLIEARLVYATDEFQRSMGIKWGGGQSSTHSGGKYVSGIYGSQGGTEPIADPDFSGYAVNLPIQGASTFGLGAFFSKITGNEMYTLDAKLDLGESQGQVNTISSPRVVTLNNQLAEITQGTKIATKNESESGGTTTEYVDATLKLAVTPQITPDNTLILELDISDDSPVTGGEDIETRSLQTRLFVDNDQTVVIGGVQQLNQSNVQDRVPGLARIPLLGWLFKNEYKTRTKRELLIFIRPHILQS